MQNLEMAQWHLARACIYEILGGFLSNRPTAETIAQLTNPQTVDVIATLFDDPEVDAKLNRLADLCQDGALSPEQVALDFEGLIRVPGASSYTHPYESSYSDLRCGDTSVKWGRLCGPQTQEVKRYYLEEKLEPRYDRVDYADHIGAELAFMAHMCRRTAEAIQAEQVADSECCQDKLRQFALDHLFTWTEEFSSELKAKADTPFFQAVAVMLAAFLNMEKHALAVH